MTGLLLKKYHVAILDNDNNGFVKRVVGALKEWYSHKIVIKTYSNCHAMFEDVNLQKAKNHPFDMAVVSSELIAERLVLQRVNPNMRVVVCDDEDTFKKEASKVLL
jgi:hypothetical protein